MVRVGLAGLGFMGVTHYNAWQNVEGAELVAVCEAEAKKLSGDWTDVQGNFGGSGGVQDLSGYKRFSDFNELIGDPDIDLVDICLPTKHHPWSAIASLKAGKATFSEKPIAIASADGATMIEAARETGRPLFVGHVLRLWPEWAWLKSTIDSGQYGKLTALNIRRVITMPAWSADLGDLSYNGGPLVDLHIHDVNWLLYALGKPKRLFATGHWAGDVVRYAAVNFDYGDGPTVSAQSGIVTQSGRGFNHCFEAYFETANVAYSGSSEPEGVDAARNQSSNQVVTVYLPDGTATFPEMAREDGFTLELQHVARCVEKGEGSAILSPEAALESLRIVELEAESVRTGGIVHVG